MAAIEGDAASLRLWKKASRSLSWISAPLLLDITLDVASHLFRSFIISAMPSWATYIVLRFNVSARCAATNQDYDISLTLLEQVFEIWSLELLGKRSLIYVF